MTYETGEKNKYDLRVQCTLIFYKSTRRDNYNTLLAPFALQLLLLNMYIIHTHILYIYTANIILWDYDNGVGVFIF